MQLIYNQSTPVVQKRWPIFLRHVSYITLVAAICVLLAHRTSAQTQPPAFSVQPGFYNEPITLEITHPDRNVRIYYTTDGSFPDEQSRVYEGPMMLFDKSHTPNAHSLIRTNPPETDARGFGWKEPSGRVPKAHIIRAVAVPEENTDAASVPVSGSWFVGLEEQPLPVLSLVGEHDHLFHSETGIYIPGALYDKHGYGDGPWGYPNANYHQRGVEWERPFSLEWFENGNRFFSQDMGIRIHGGGSRAAPLKSLRLYARNSYGSRYFEHRVFPGQPHTSYKRLILRNSGQDFYHQAVMFRDAFIQRLFSDLQVQTQAYRPVLLFLNGEFWGIHNIRERYDKHFIERTYQVPEEHLDLLTRNAEAKEGSADHYTDMLRFIEEHPLAKKQHLQELSTRMDLQNYTDYVIGNVFVYNYDWPGNNIDYWRYNGPPDSTRAEKDGRWRWLVYDTDFGFGFRDGNRSWEFDMLAHVTDTQSTGWPNPQWSTFLIRSLFESPEYVSQFVTRFSDLLNTRFRTDTMIPILDEMAEFIRPALPEHIRRWRYPSSMDQWHDNVEHMRNFARQRPHFQWQHLQDHFELGTLFDLTIQLEGSGLKTLHLNSLILDSGSRFVQELSRGKPFEANYFEDTQLHLSAKAWPGFELSHWLVNGAITHDSTLNLPITETLEITAVFSETETSFDHALPEPFVLTEDESFSFTYWSDTRPAGKYPEHMHFVYMDRPEPGLDAQVEDAVSGAYNLTSRTRINALGDGGFAFINTSNLDGNPGYPGRRLGGALVGLNTMQADSILVSWTGGTVLPNSREYHLRLQYRIGDEGLFHDVLFADGTPVEYRRNEQPGHEQTIGPVMLPVHASGKPYVQLLWRYYHSGIRYDEDSGQRSMMQVSDIQIHADATPSAAEPDPEYEGPDAYGLRQNYPNPFNPTTTIAFVLDQTSRVTLTVYDIMGRHLQTLTDTVYDPGTHRIPFDGSRLSSGLYIYTMDTDTGRQSRKMLLVK